MLSIEENSSTAHHNLSASDLVEHALAFGEGYINSKGALATATGGRTGRSTNDRYIIQDTITSSTVDWGVVNKSFHGSKFDMLWHRVEDYLSTRRRYVSDLYVGQDLDYGLPFQLTTETAWHSLFASNMFMAQQDGIELAKKDVGWTVLHAANFVCDPHRDGTHSDAAVMINVKAKKVLIAGMKYAGELKKSMFSVMNYLMPAEGVMPMHCAANVGEKGDTTLFFGLSGTGKTTLSADPERYLVGDDEHGWAPGSVFNFEGGCYAKTIDLSQKNEPDIWQAIRAGAIVENVFHVASENSPEKALTPDYSNTSISENGRCSYPLQHIGKRMLGSRNPEPSNIVFLTCDVMGVLPPVACLSKEAAAFHFLSGYTARVGSTELGAERGVNPVFSSCFGAPFMPRPTSEYADLLMARISAFGSRVYLVNTGWTGGTGGADGSGSRFPIPVTREIIGAIHRGELETADTEHLDIMNLEIPVALQGVDSRYLNPEKAWRDVAAYQRQASILAGLFRKNMAKFDVSENILSAGPVVDQPAMSLAVAG